ncbi:MAG: tetratricopeptide repeat protein [Deltaproteobacteria bacterium]|nr:tetratricopeptide repeat protein [Deltaproteobacteria bacterium]
MIYTLIFCFTNLISGITEAPKPQNMDNAELFNYAVGIYAKASSPSDYENAAKAFEILISRGIHHENLFYNLGNAYYKAGKYGYAVYSYERSLKLHPKHKDTLHNIKLTRQVIERKYKDNIVSFAESSLWVRMVNWMNFSTMKIIFIVLWSLFFGILTWLYFRESGLLRISMITGAVLTGVFVLIFAIMISGRYYFEHIYRFGIVLPDEISVKEAPQKSSNTAFKIHAGLKIKINLEDQAWVKISLPNGMEGWVEKNTIGTL